MAVGTAEVAGANGGRLGYDARLEENTDDYPPDHYIATALPPRFRE